MRARLAVSRGPRFYADMAKEIERKFLVGNDEWRRAARSGSSIEQFYVAASEERSVRLRIRDGKRAVLTLKFGADSRIRDEFEYEIPVDDAREMRAYALGSVIFKTRHLVRRGPHEFEVDEYLDTLEGLVVAELEGQADIEAADLPDWLGLEVTGEPAYYNLNLALHGLKA